MTRSSTPTWEHLDELQQRFPEIYDRLDQERVARWQYDVGDALDVVDEFGPESAGGRGESYLRAQSGNRTVRRGGIVALLDLLRRDSDDDGLVLDLLGGDGLVRLVAGEEQWFGPEIVTCDVSRHMVDAAWANGCPAVLQSADQLLFRTGSVDGVLLAYGTHHVPPARRAQVVHEAFRVLRPGGVLVVHDFPTGSPMAAWFAHVVDRHSTTGHAFDHFTGDEIDGLLRAAGFASRRVLDLDDSYVVCGSDPRSAELEMGRYLADMYGLVGMAAPGDDRAAAARTIELAREIFRTDGEDGVTESVSVQAGNDGRWTCRVPRRALVGIGIKGSGT